MSLKFQEYGKVSCDYVNFSSYILNLSYQSTECVAKAVIKPSGNFKNKFKINK